MEPKIYTAEDYAWMKDREAVLREKYGDGDGVDWSPEGQAYWEMQHDRPVDKDT